ncbi:ATP synthase epsilon chain [bacterium HR19]|nr:ATP synthase epsilon chain [bacterium HR19]
MGMKVKIISPSKKIFEGEAVSLLINTEIGETEILEKHAKLMAIIKGKIKIKEQDGKESEFELKDKKSLIHVDNQEITIFIL